MPFLPPNQQRQSTQGFYHSQTKLNLQTERKYSLAVTNTFLSFLMPSELGMPSVL